MQNAPTYCDRCCTALETGLYQPVEYHSEDDNIGIIFDSGYTTTIKSYASDLYGAITPVQKTITGLGLTSTVQGEGTVKWTF